MPVAQEIQTEIKQTPAGVLKLRGSHTAPNTEAYPELDREGVSERAVQRAVLTESSSLP